MNNDLIVNIKSFHKYFKLLGDSQQPLLDVSKPLLSYFLTILRDDNPLLCPITSENEWAFLISELSKHGLMPLLYTKIARLPESRQPPVNIKNKFKEAFLKNNLAYQVYLRQLREILNAFAQADVEVIVLKGLALAWAVYPDFAARPFGDIDILVRPQNFLLARKSLSALGYRTRFNRFEHYKDICKAEDFFHEKGRQRPLILDLHWNLFDHYGIVRNDWTADVFDQAEPVKVPGISVNTLNPVDALIHSAVHLTLNHNEGIRLIWIADIALLAKKLTEMNVWPSLEKKLDESKTSVVVQHALEAAQLWFKVQIPDDFLRYLSNFETDAAERLEINYAIGRKTSNIRFSGYLRTIRMAPNKITFLLQLVFPEPAYVRVAYPPKKPWLLPLSYVKRWVYWLKELFHFTHQQMKEKSRIHRDSNSDLR